MFEAWDHYLFATLVECQEALETLKDSLYVK